MIATELQWWLKLFVINFIKDKMTLRVPVSKTRRNASAQTRNTKGPVARPGLWICPISARRTAATA
jgi:hypothetical protein